jgi:threonylcarbamoyladenosine tRNA methylthiotransferase MtaB
VAGASRGPDAAGRRRAKVAVVALGCRVARSDVDALAAALGPGFEAARPGEAADYVVVQTCTVTADADAASRQALRRAAREHPAARVVAAGCYAEVAADALRRVGGVAAVVGARAPGGVAALLAAWEGEGAASAPAAAAPHPSSPPWPGRRTRALLKVQDGCDAACAYCVVPRARGPARSLPLDAALGAVAAQARASPEVVLAGVHLGAYGQDLRPRSSLAALVAAIAERGLAPRLRLSSVEPLEFPVELFDGPARAVLCDHAHLPLQSGSARVLAAMRRPYRPADYARVVERLAAAAPGLCLGADVLTGFPGEREDDHRATLALVRASPLAYLHVFPFSPRPGTAAASLPDHVAPAVARARAAELAALSAERWAAFCDAQRGRVLEVAVERVAGGVARGTARNYAAVRFPAAGARRGDRVAVRVEGRDGEVCVGVLAAPATPLPRPSTPLRSAPGERGTDGSSAPRCE